jgi:hypothetical protein
MRALRHVALGGGFLLMPVSLHCRRLAAAVFTGCAVAVVTLATPIGFGALNAAHAQVSDEFQAALAPYGEWREHPRWGQVWVPLDRPDGWRPYTYGHWVYTDDWGWYWVSDDDEADWGWVTYHYGRWVFDRGMGWLWVPGEEWAPAWVDWRRGEDAVGWAPLPPTELAADAEYSDDPNYWVFVQPRYMMAPRLRGYVLPPQRATVFFRDSVLVNRTVRLDHQRGRIAVNPGIAPNIIAAVTRGAVPTYRVQPRVVAGTQGVQGAVQVRPQDLGRRGPPGQPGPRGQRQGPSRMQATVQRTTTVIQPAATVPKPEALGRDDRGGRLGSRPPRAAQGGTVAPAQQQPQQAPQQQQQQRPEQQPQRPAQATPPAATQPPGSAPPAGQPRPESSRPGAPPQERQEQRQEQRQDRRDQRPPVSASPAASPQGQPPQQRRDERPPQARPERPPAPQTPPPPAPGVRPAAPPPAAHPPRPPEARPPAPPPAARPPAPPPAARPAPPAPPAARPAPPPPRPAAPPPPRPAQPQKPPPKPGEKPPEEKK